MQGSHVRGGAGRGGAGRGGAGRGGAGPVGIPASSLERWWQSPPPMVASTEMWGIPALSLERRWQLPPMVASTEMRGPPVRETLCLHNQMRWLRQRRARGDRLTKRPERLRTREARGLCSERPGRSTREQFRFATDRVPANRRLELANTWVQVPRHACELP